MKRLVQKHPLPIRWSHWLNVPLLAIMVWSGVLIYWANQEYVEIPRTFALGPLRWRVALRLSEGLRWHWTFGWFFAINGLVWVTYTLASGRWRQLFPDRRSWREAIETIKLELRFKKAPTRGLYNGAQRVAYTGVMLMGAGIVLTGLAIYKPWQLGWLTWLLGGYAAARLEHFILTLAFVGFVVIHVAQAIRYGWTNLRSMLTGHEIGDEPETVSPPPTEAAAQPVGEST